MFFSALRYYRGTGFQIQGAVRHKRELKQAVLVKLPKGTRHID